MLTSQSRFETAKASSYLQQMCKHFAHKVEASFDETQGKVEFSIGIAEFSAYDSRLTIDVQADTDEQLQQTKGVIESHLVRFAFRENLERLDWSK